MLNFLNFEEIVIIRIYLDRSQWGSGSAAKGPGQRLWIIAIWEHPLWEEPKRKCLLVAAAMMRTGFGATYPHSCLPLGPSSQTAHSAHAQWLSVLEMPDFPGFTASPSAHVLRLSLFMPVCCADLIFLEGNTPNMTLFPFLISKLHQEKSLLVSLFPKRKKIFHTVWVIQMVPLGMAYSTLLSPHPYSLL